MDALSLDLSNYIINQSSSKRSRKNYRQKISENINSKFSEQNVDFIVVHWDSKILPALSGIINVDHWPIIATVMIVE